MLCRGFLLHLRCAWAIGHSHIAYHRSEYSYMLLLQRDYHALHAAIAWAEIYKRRGAKPVTHEVVMRPCRLHRSDVRSRHVAVDVARASAVLQTRVVNGSVATSGSSTSSSTSSGGIARSVDKDAVDTTDIEVHNSLPVTVIAQHIAPAAVIAAPTVTGAATAHRPRCAAGRGQLVLILAAAGRGRAASGVEFPGGATSCTSGPVPVWARHKTDADVREAVGTGKCVITQSAGHRRIDEVLRRRRANSASIARRREFDRHGV